ncbi:MAG TPA: OB-fold nucleic acid binding domain-containing protein, partial [Burkholderiaceae bacterium]|nr:OB-fold nucleic acid binding domain-containing protein [Burkholderiaceae bacterium]
DLIPSFCGRKHGRERVEYPDPRVEPILAETYGIMVYQEQVMQMAQIIGGYSLGGADLLRRAMGKKKPEEMAKHREIFREGASKNGISEQKANEMFDLMEKFAGYGFNKSHAAAYALLAYQTAYLKAHYPAEFFAANMSCALDDSDKIKSLWEDATRRNGLKILPPDINASDYRFTPTDAKTIRYGLGGIKGTGENAVNMILKGREASGAYKSLFDFATRVDRRVVNKRTMEALVRAGAFDKLEADRARLFAGIEQATDYAEQVEAAANQTSLFGEPGAAMEPPALVETLGWSEQQRLIEEKAVFGFSLSGHLFTAVEREVRQIARTPLSQLKPGREAQTMAGVVTGVRLMNGKRGRMAIVTLDDATTAQEIMVFGDAFEAHRAQLVEDAVLVIVGQVRQDDYSGGFRVIADRILTLAEARLQFAKCVKFCFTESQRAAPQSLFTQQGEDSTGLRIQIEVINGIYAGTLNLPHHLRAPADDALLRTAAAAARASRYEIVY